MAALTAAPNPDGGWSGRGLGWIDAGDGFAQLAELLHDDATYAAIVPVDWTRFMSRLPTGVDRSFFRSVAPADPLTADGPVEPPGPSAVVASWRSAPAGDRRKQVVSYVAGRARHVLGAEDDLAWDERVPLKDVGLDSLMAVELRNDLTRALDHPLPATLLFDHPSLDALAAYLLDALELLPARTPSTPEAAPATDAGGDDLTALSDEEAEALLLAELGLQEGAP